MSTLITVATPAAPSPDCTSALRAWQEAFRKRKADGVFRRALDPLARQIRALLAQAPTGGKPLTFDALDQMPQSAQDFYTELIDAAESLAELMEDHLPDKEEDRHAALALIGDALGAFRNATTLTLIARCGCRACKQALKERSPRMETEGTGTP
ncbi:hypothetical protein ABZ023_18585 [Streptomyces sp. NPDC006367]|uniref:hypothetical protein n=1 Tax=unclassified Streptomyces TaxID=2593676 RepID=UPI0033B61E66